MCGFLLIQQSVMDKQVFEYLEKLAQNNNREWFADNKTTFEEAKKNALQLFNQVYALMTNKDTLEPMKMYRIYRDVRFSKDKTPYKTHFSMYAGRQKPDFRGGYYLHIEPNNSFIGIGFSGPNKEDLLRIRKEIELDDELEQILNLPAIQKTFGELVGEELKTAPKNFDKNHKRIHLIRKKQFLLVHKFTNKEVLQENFHQKAAEVFHQSRPFVDYMTDVLLTDMNGERV